MDRVGYAASLNNEGVSKLLDGKHQKAIALLRHSLAETKGILRVLSNGATVKSQCPPIDEAFNPKQEDDHASKPSTVIDADGASDTCLHSTLCPLHDLQSVEEGFLYSNAIMLNPIKTKESGNSDMEHDLNVYCACIVFNLALVYHCISKRTRSNGQCLDLRKASHMYDLILKLLSRCRHCDRKVGTVNLLLMCAMNNLSHILYFDMGEYHRANYGLRSVAVLLTTSHKINCCDESGTVSREQTESPEAGNFNWLRASDKQGFLWNICMLRSPNFAAAA